jgi:protease YdgD
VLVGALGLAGAAGSNLPGVGAADPRVVVSADVLPWRALARLQIPGIGRCTAVLVAPRLAVTAAHCLWGVRLGRFVPAGSVHVLTGYASGSFTRHTTATGFRIASGYDPRDPNGTRGADIAVVTLAVPMDHVIGLAVETPDVGEAALLGGYNQDRAEVIEADLHCTVAGRRADRGGRALLLHDCAATRGTSGGPLLVRDEDGTIRVAGIQVAGAMDRPGGLAVPAASIRRLIEADQAAGGR